MSEHHDFQISFRLGQHRWSDIDVWITNEHIDYCATHIFSSPIEDILKPLIALESGAIETSFTIHEEPGEHVWSLFTSQESLEILQVEICSYSENFSVSQAAYETKSFKVSIRFFIESFLLEFEKISTLLQHDAFAENRYPEEFPWAEVKELRRVFSQNK